MNAPDRHVTPRSAPAGARVSLLLLALLSACGGGDGTTAPPAPPPPPPPPPPPAAVASVSVAPDSLEVAASSTGQLVATARDAQGAPLAGRTVTWTSADPAIATVSTTGLVTAVAAGRVQVTATVEGRSASAHVRVRGVADTLPGPVAAPAVAAIPLRQVRMRAGDYRTDHPSLPGLPISINTVMVLVDPSASTGAVNALLRSADAQVVGGVPGVASQVAGVLVLRLPTRTHPELAAVMTSLQQSAVVRAIVPTARLQEAVVSRTGGDAATTQWRWNTLVVTMVQGNWGLKTLRVPQLWNLNAFVRRGGATTTTGVFDTGFERHEDLIIAADLTAPDTPVSEGGRTHGTHVAGTIAATFDNGSGVDGVNPFTRLVVKGDADFASMITGLVDLLLSTSGASRPRVINASLGYNWSLNDINTATNAAARLFAQTQGLLFATMLRLVQQQGVPLPVIVAAAGNDSEKFPAQQARYGSPFANAALEHGARAVIVVEALQQGGTGVERAAFSNTGGSLSAPGVAVMSTIPAAPPAAPYGRKSGTSMAAPHVAGLVSYLLALEPAFPAPTMSSNPMLDLLRATALPVPGAAPQVDAFAAALEMDQVRGTDRVLRALLDVDDGTPDGNTRLDLRSQSPVSGEVAGARDGRIDMRDFRVFRDQLLQASGREDARLDGAASHPKRDLNGDGVAGAPPEENVYPRTDFNGDGRLTLHDSVAVAGVVRGARRTDLQVLQQLFEDPDHARDELPSLVESGDLLFDPVACLAVPGATRVRGTVRRAEEGSLPVRTFDLTAAAPRKVTTVPATKDEGYIARLSARDAAGEELAFHEQLVFVHPGSDDLVDDECVRLTVDVTLPEELAVGTPQPLGIRVRRHVPRLGQEGPVANADVTITVVGGEAVSVFGATDAAGAFGTFILPAAGPPSVTVVVEVDTRKGGTSVQVTRPILGALPCAPGIVSGTLSVTTDAALPQLASLGRTTRTLVIGPGTFTELVDLRRFCEAAFNLEVSGTFRGGLRLDGIEAVGNSPEDNALLNNGLSGRLRVTRLQGVPQLFLPRLRYVGLPLVPDQNGVVLDDNPELRTVSIGRDVPLLEVTRLYVERNPQLTSLRVFPEMRLPSLARWLPSSTNRNMEHIILDNNALLESAVFGKVTSKLLRVVNNPSLRTLTLGSGSQIQQVIISGSPLLQALALPCETLASASITVVGSPKLDVVALEAAAARCALALGVVGPPPRIVTRATTGGGAAR
jgi:hypothetical protein